jgi:hypothetical protein
VIVGRKIMVASTNRSRVRECLVDADFPADKEQLVEVARRNGCDEDTLGALRAMPPERYSNMSEVLASVTHDDTSLGDAEKAAAHRIDKKPGMAQTAKDVPPPNPIVDELGDNRKS